MSLLLIFNRKVIPIPPDPGEKPGAGRVETEILGFMDGEPFEVGLIKFPSKQSWTKFWGAIQRGTLEVPELEVKMQNVPFEEEAPPTSSNVKIVGNPNPPTPSAAK